MIEKVTKSMASPAPQELPQEAMDSFEQQLLSGMDDLATERNFEEYLAKLVDFASIMLARGVLMADAGAQFLDSMKPQLKLWPKARTAYWFSYIWPESLKSYFVLLRDIMVEGNRAQVLAKEGDADHAGLQALKKASLTTLQNYWTELRKGLNAEEQKMHSNVESFLQSWNHQTNPWPSYVAQFQLLEDQFTKIKTEQVLLAQAGLAYHSILELTHETISLCEAQLQKVHEQSIHVVQYIKENENEKPAALLSKIEEVQQLVNFPHRLEHFLLQLESHLDALPEKILVAIGNQSGKLITKDIAFKKISRQWIESEILPQLYEFWEIIDRANNGLQVSLLNIQNRVALIEKEEGEENTKEAAPVSLNQPLEVFLENAAQREGRLELLHNNVNQQLQDEFRVSKAFDAEQYFLPNTYGLSQLRLNENEFLQRSINLWNKGKNAIRDLQSSVELEDALSLSEKIARAIVQRTGDPKNEQYNNIFLTKGYLGESFVVGRRQEFAHLEQLIDQWKNGFRGAALLTGPRFCGKTLFGEMIATNYFPRNVIRLQPNTFVQVDGRRFPTKFNLREALEFIKKHTINQQPLIWLDDLELWNDPATPLGQNVRALEQFISKHSSRMFFIVSCSAALRAHLEKGYKLRYSFQAIINLDRMATNEIKEAILIRHGATHKKLVTEEGETVSPVQFKKMTEEVIKQSGGNVGEAFFNWAMHVDRFNVEQVCYRHERLFYLPDFINADNGILLAAIYLEKSTNEYRLRKLFGPAFKDRYSAILQRLLRTKVIIRRMDGWLSINDLLVNELKEMLLEKNFLLK